MNFHTDKWIIDKLTNHYEYAVGHLTDYKVIGVFLHGSQNYGLDFETSDVDSICLVMPSKEDILKVKEPMSKELTIEESNEKIVVWEIRKFINFLEKGGFNQLEVLYTDYYVLAPDYFGLWEFIRRHKEYIAYLNKYRTANSFLGMINRCVKEIKKDNTNYIKEYMRVAFFAQCLISYLVNTDFEKILRPCNSNELKFIRSKPEITFPRTSAIELSERELVHCKELINTYKESNNNYDCCTDTFEQGTIAINAIRDVLFDCIKTTIFN